MNASIGHLTAPGALACDRGIGPSAIGVGDVDAVATGVLHEIRMVREQVLEAMWDVMRNPATSVEIAYLSDVLDGHVGLGAMCCDPDCDDSEVVYVLQIVDSGNARTAERR